MTGGVLSDGGFLGTDFMMGAGVSRTMVWIFVSRLGVDCSSYIRVTAGATSFLSVDLGVILKFRDFSTGVANMLWHAKLAKNREKNIRFILMMPLF
jgi:hypothetical protein